MSDTGWNLAELREHVRTNEARQSAVLPLLSSIGRSFEIFEFHKALARDALVGIINTDAPASRENFDLIFGISEKSDQFAAARLASEAHVLGVLYSTRSLVEQLAQLMNVLLISEPLRIESCDAKKVAAKLSASPLKARFQALLECEWFNHVDAFVNTTKHRRLISHGLTVSFEQNLVGARFADFEYNQKQYEARWAHEVLEGAIEIINAVVTCGRVLNREVIDT